jgi:hypothetical protein
MDETVIKPEFNYPKYEYTFEVTNTFFESGTFEVKYMPKKETLMSVSYTLPILATFNVTDIGSYVDNWAPHDRWFAQEFIIKNENLMKGAIS